MSATNGHVITQKDRSDLEEVESQIERHITKISDGFKLIRDRKLYLIHADTLEEYARVRWNRTRQWLYDQIEIEEVREALPPEMSNAIDTVTKARELQKVPKKRMRRVIERILGTEKNVTPRAIKEAAKEEMRRTPPPMPPEEPIDIKEIVHDMTGYEVPEHLVEFYENGRELGKELTGRVSSLRGALRKAESEKDPHFAFISISTTMRQLDSVFAELTMLTPHVVCPMCQGQVKSNCVLCRKTGFIPKHIWDHAVDSNLKAVRQRGIDQKKKG